MLASFRSHIGRYLLFVSQAKRSYRLSEKTLEVIFVGFSRGTWDEKSLS